MSLLTIIQTASELVGLNSPASAIGLTDLNVVKMIALARKEGKELARRHAWQALVQEATHTTLATESQGLITTICGADFNYIINDTFWNRTQNRPWHPASDAQWQQMKSSNITGPVNHFRIRGRLLIVLPVPTAGDTVAFEWVSKNWCESSGGTGKSSWTVDSDVGRLDEDIMTAGLIWRWKASQGLEYAEDFRDYEIQVNDAIAQDGVKGHIHMNSKHSSQSNVPEGSWSI